jgi:hypothetical protein
LPQAGRHIRCAGRRAGCAPVAFARRGMRWTSGRTRIKIE